MSSQNASQITEKILSILRRRGPSLPVHISKETGLSILFAGAFLSQMVSEKTIRFSDMKVGSSPLYFINEQAYMLERFGQYLKSKEKDAFNLLREKKFLKDAEQSPQIRVALRAIKDFAVPFNKDGQIIWRYYTISESEFKPEIIEPAIQVKEEPIKPKVHPAKIEEKIIEKPLEIKLEKPKEIKKELQQELDIFNKPKKTRKKSTLKKKIQKYDENFFNKVKEWVLKNSMEIIDIQNFNRNELHLKIKRDGKEQLLVAYNKKRLTDSDLVRANKKAKELGLGYGILSFGELKKKMSDIIEAARNLSEIKKIE